MRDKLYYFLLGFMTMGLIAMFVVRYHPTPETDQACGSCGSKAWWFQLAEGDEE